MFKRLIRFLEPPVSPAEAERQAQVIRPVYWVGVGLTAMVGCLQLLTLPGERLSALPALLTLAVLLLAYPLMQARRERLAGLLILAASSVINFYSMVTQGGVLASASRTYEVLIVAAGLVLGPQLVLPMTGVAVAAFVAALLGQAQGWVASPLNLAQAQVHAMTSIGLMLATGVLVYFAARALRQRASFNEGVVAALPGVVHIFDRRHNRSTWLNRSLSASLGWTPDQLGDDALSRLMHPEDLAQMPGWLARWDQAEDGQILSTLFRMKSAKGEWRSFESLDTVYQRDGQGRVVQFIGYIEDNTDKRRTQENLVRSERLQSLGQLAGGVAHDFNNVLAPIMGNAELIRRGLPEGSEGHQAAVAILRSAERARELTRRMLGLSSDSSLERLPTDLNQVLASFLPLLRRSLRQDLTVDFHPDPRALPVLADAGQVERALLNLGLNAQDALGGQGGLRVATRVQDGHAVLDFEDNGPGMAPEVRSRAFEPFFTTKQPGQGTGLGLSSVHAVMQQHGGRVELESEPGFGCRFSLHFPLQGPTSSAEREEAWPGTVLLVDDEEDLRLVLKRLLESLGWRVLEAATGDSAVAVAAAEPGSITLLVSDIRLPGLRGPDLARHLSILRPRLRTVFISGFSEAQDLGAPLLAKPFSLDQLKAVLEQMRPRA